MKFCHCRDRLDIARELARRYRVINEMNVSSATKTLRRNRTLRMARDRLLTLAGQLEQDEHPALPFSQVGIDDLDRITVSYSSQSTGSLEWGDCDDDATPGRLAQYHTSTDGRWVGHDDRRKLVGATYWSCGGDAPLTAPAVSASVRLIRCGRAGWVATIASWREWWPTWRIPQHSAPMPTTPDWREPPQPLPPVVLDRDTTAEYLLARAAVARMASASPVNPVRSLLLTMPSSDRVQFA